jgi:hypothetical protein
MTFPRWLTNVCSDRLGERRFLTIDPNGCLIDIGSPC